MKLGEDKKRDWLLWYAYLFGIVELVMSVKCGTSLELDRTDLRTSQIEANSKSQISPIRAVTHQLTQQSGALRLSYIDGKVFRGHQNFKANHVVKKLPPLK